MKVCIYDKTKDCDEKCQAFQLSSLGHSCKIVNSGIAIAGSLNRLETLLGDIKECLKK